MPISIRIGTNRPEDFYEGLARRLTEITGGVLPGDAIRNSDGFRYAVRDLINRIADNSDRRVLIVIDGLDEALEGSFNADVLPNSFPEFARLAIGAMADWRLRL